MSIISVGIIIVFVFYILTELSLVAKDEIVEKVKNRRKNKWVI